MALSPLPRVEMVGAPAQVGRKLVWYGEITFDSSYATDGLAITPAMFGLTAIEHVQLTPAASTAARMVLWDRANSKLVAYASIQAGTQVPSTTDLSALTVHATVWGR